MIVHFSAATPTFEQRFGLYKNIIRIIEGLGHTTTMKLEELPTLIEEAEGMLDQEEWKLLCRRELGLLDSSDVAIFDVTNKSTFGIGYQAAQAVVAGKPTLLLQEKGSLKGSFINGLEHPLIVRQEYLPKNLPEVIKAFLQESL